MKTKSFLLPNHTPGPWTIDGEFIYGGNIRIADTSLCDGDEAPDYQLDANNRLIAAAPDLLEALRFALTILDAVADGRAEDIEHCVADAAVKAAEALGKADDNF